MLIILEIVVILKFKKKTMKINKSKEIFLKAKKIIPAQSQTFSKNWTQYPYEYISFI